MGRTEMYWERCVCGKRKRRTKWWKKGRTVQTGIHTRQVKPGRAGTSLLGKGQLDCPFHPLPSHQSNYFLLSRGCNGSQVFLTTGVLILSRGYPQPVPLCTCGYFISLLKGSSFNFASLPTSLIIRSWNTRHQETLKLQKKQGHSFPREAHVASPWAGMRLLSACSKSVVKISWFKGKSPWLWITGKGRARVVKRQ